MNLTLLAAAMLAGFVLGATWHSQGCNVTEARRLVNVAESVLDDADAALEDCVRLTRPNAERHRHAE
jgi:hypothetical protein